MSHVGLSQRHDDLAGMFGLHRADTAFNQSNASVASHSSETGNREIGDASQHITNQ